MKVLYGGFYVLKFKFFIDIAMCSKTYMPVFEQIILARKNFTIFFLIVEEVKIDIHNLLSCN